jgi:flagellar biosynthetic protein FliR
MVAPGYSSDRIPIYSRLYLSIAISITLTPVLEDKLAPNFDIKSIYLLLTIIIHELFFGFSIGLVCRLFTFALETFTTTFCLTIGLANIFDASLFDSESFPTLSTLIILLAIELIFITDLHHYLLQGAVNSYYIAPIAQNYHLSVIINEISKMLSQSYLLAFRITSPLLVYAIIVNLSFAFLARLNTHTPVYFISGPIIVFLGMYVFFIISPEFIGSIIITYQQLIFRG